MSWPPGSYWDRCPCGATLPVENPESCGFDDCPVDLLTGEMDDTAKAPQAKAAEPSLGEESSQGSQGVRPIASRVPAKVETVSKFSDFIRNATTEEKERVYTEVMVKATERQMSDTPRTNVVIDDSQDRPSEALAFMTEHARQLERELLDAAPQVPSTARQGRDGEVAPDAPLPAVAAPFQEAFSVIFHNMDENGDPVGGQPESSWEHGHAAALRWVYRTLKSRGIK